MLVSADVIAAKLLVQLGDATADAARAAMRAIDAAPAGGQDVVARLHDEDVLDQPRVARARRYVGLYEAVRLEGMFVSQLEKRAGFARDEVHQLLAQLEVEVYRRRLGAILVEAGRLTEAEERAVTERVRELVRKDDERVLGRYRAEDFAGVARPLLPGVTAITAETFRVPVVFRSAKTQRIVKAAVLRLRGIEGPAPPPPPLDLSSDPLVEEGTFRRSGGEPEPTRAIAAPPGRPAAASPSRPAPLPAQDDRRPCGEAAGSSPEGGERAVPRSGSLDPAASLREDDDDDDGQTGEETGEIDGGPRPETTRMRASPAPDKGELGEDLRSRTRIGPYEVVECLGQGGMGAVYLGRDEREGALVAVKVLLADRAKVEDRARFRREIELLGRIKHTSVVNMIEAGRTDDGLDYMAIPAYPGRSLRSVLREAATGLEVGDGLEVVALLLGALAGVHKGGVVHRDLKPENVFVLPGKERNIRLLDFGIGRPLGDDALPADKRAFRTATGVISGSPAYVAPETVTGDPIDGRTDIYSLGVLLFECVTGKLPLTADTPYDFLRAHLLEPPLTLAQARRDLGWAPELEALVARMLGKEREQRPTANEALTALRGGVIAAAVAAAKAGPPPAAPANEGGVGGFFRRLGRSWS